jgi:hypothetical protein
LFLQGIGYCDLNVTSANKPYKVPFSEWVLVYVSVQCGSSEENYGISVMEKVINKKFRFTVTGYYRDTPIGHQWYQNVGSKIENLIALDCKNWTMEGHPISLNDFEIDIHEIP